MTTASIIAAGSEMLGTTRVDTNSLKITSILEDFAVPQSVGHTRSRVGQLAARTVDGLAALIPFRDRAGFGLAVKLVKLGPTHLRQASGA